MFYLLQAVSIIDEVGDLLKVKVSRIPVPTVTVSDPGFRRRYKLDGAFEGEELDKMD